MATRDSDTAQWVDDRLTVLTPPAEWEPDVARGLASLRHQRLASSRRRWLMLVATAAPVVVFTLPMPVVTGFAHACGEYVRRTVSGGSAMHSADRSMALVPFALSASRGKVVLVTYATPDCVQCATERAWFSEFERTYAARGFEVVGIALAQAGQAPSGVTSIPTTLL